MERLWRDLRYGLRRLRNTPGFTLVAVLTLALGIGVNTSMFSVIEATILGGLPYPAASRLVRVFRTSPQSQSWPHSAANVLDYQAKNDAFEKMAVFTWSTFNLAEPGQPPERVDGVAVGANFFPTLSMQPALGRVFTADEDRPGSNDVVVLSHGFWMRRYAGDPSIVGRTVRMDGRPTTIVGVMPPGADYPVLWGPVDVWHPLALTDEQKRDRNNNWLNALARLKPDVSIREAQARMSLLSTQLKSANGNADSPDGLRVVGLLESGMNATGQVVSWMCLGLAGLVLLIACANIANLQIARVSQRSREYAVRSALGAARRRLLRESLTESLLLGMIGGGVGIVVACWCNGYLGRSIVIGDRAGFDIPLNWPILGFATAISVGAGAISGLFPSWMAARADVNQALKQGSRGTSSRSQHRLRNVLVVAQIALALVLLASSALFVGGLRRFMSRDPGWAMDHVLTGFVSLPKEGYPDDATRRAFQARLLERLAAQPGVESVAIASSLPIWPYRSSTNLRVEDRPAPPVNQEPLFYSTQVGHAFFETLGIPLLQGSTFPKDVRPDGPRLALVNEAAARRFWPNQSPIGKRLGDGGDDPRWREIIGVVGDVRFPAQLGEPDTPYQIYVPLEQEPRERLAVAVRVSSTPSALVGPLRAAVAAVDPDLPVSEVATPQEQVRRGMTSFGLAGQVLTAFGLLGLLLAALGIYGVITNVVVHRTSEFGIRVAVGAQVRDILWLVLAKGLRLSLWGAALGIVGSVALARLLLAAVPSLQSNSAAVVASVTAVLTAVAMVACWLPAWRATQVDPLVALRQE
jgi:putative ABC transport system permease protein